LTIRCEDRITKVHKVIVCSQSDFFDRACSNKNFIVRFQNIGCFSRIPNRSWLTYRTQQEGQSGVITLYEVDPTMVENMFHYLYHKDYLPYDRPELYLPYDRPGLDPNERDYQGTVWPTYKLRVEHLNGKMPELELSMHVRMYELANLYLIPGLKAHAEDRFKREIKRLTFTDERNRDQFIGLLNMVLIDEPANLDPDGVFKRCLVAALAASAKLLKDPRIQELIDAIPGLGTDILLERVGVQNSLRGSAGQ